MPDQENTTEETTTTTVEQDGDSAPKSNTETTKSVDGKEVEHKTDSK
ncbi:hypothetical protein CCAX7_58240 [Capsulimonas corticalis]|uniref:Uncharacterized protein n=1 Tax=Capsulimonas corticalis TaxID=2219043 RepID=A0A402CZZ7_9BACT|nr:hypothetical protein [Capsulimonas corticalis]BDI33773.1 hypothetical protein CCAX7_58240 [Capsulimonas corticalis]